MHTLRDVWHSKGFRSEQVAAAAGCSIGTLYKLNRKGAEGEGVAFGIVKRVCAVVGISLDEYNALDACPRSGEFRPAEE